VSTVIPEEEVHFPKVKHLDDVGKVFDWNGRVFRAIYPGQEPLVHSLFSTGLLDDLIIQNYIPKTWVTDFRIDGFGLVLEHERIWPVVYPQEWTFSMLKDAALFVYAVALIAKRYGFNMKDSHGFNVLFDGTSPRFSDLGSFIPDRYIGWLPYEEFLKFYYYPLKIWQHNSFIGKLSIFAGRLSTHETFLNYQYPFFRRLGPSLQHKIVDLCVMPPIEAQRQLPKAQQITDFRILRPRSIMKRLVRRMIPIESIELDTVVEKIRKIKQTSSMTVWGNYHETIVENAKRFGRITEILNSLDNSVNTAVDLGGNQGRLSRLLLQETNIERVACIDADENAIEVGYNREKIARTGRITFAHFDFMDRIVKLNLDFPDERFKGDVVFALALTHHLILAQRYDLDLILRRISSYARKYAFIEFMPLGLWSTGQEPVVPDWYSLEWFRRSFIQYFDLLHEDELKVNRILFVGKVRGL
jgi:hypothetical protein